MMDFHLFIMSIYMRSILFYEKRFLKYLRLKILVNIYAIDKGVIVHQVLEDLYSPYLSMTMKTDYYDEMLKIFPKN